MKKLFVVCSIFLISQIPLSLSAQTVWFKIISFGHVGNPKMVGHGFMDRSIKVGDTISQKPLKTRSKEFPVAVTYKIIKENQTNKEKPKTPRRVTT